MTIKTIIEKGIEGGYKKSKTPKFSRGSLISKGTEYINVVQDIQDLVLDPTFWQTVIKVLVPNRSDFYYSTTATSKMHQMIDALIEGKSIEEYLKTL